MLRDLYRCAPLPFLLLSLGFALLIWAVPFYSSFSLEGTGPFGLSHSILQVLAIVLLIINAFLFRKLIDVTNIMRTGERLSLYPFIFLSSICLLNINGIVELLAISIQLLFLIRTFSAISTGSLLRAAFDSGLIIAFASLLNPIYGLLLVLFLSIAFIHALLNIRVLLLSLIGFMIPFLIYAQVAYLSDWQYIPQSLIQNEEPLQVGAQGGLFLILYLMVTLGTLLYNLYLSFNVMGTGQVRRRMLIRSGFSMVGICLGMGILSSLLGYGPAPHLAMIPALCLLCLEFMLNSKVRWESYLFLLWAFMSIAFIWSAS